MSLEHLNTLDDVRYFIDGTQGVIFGILYEPHSLDLV
jgi:hypothetical protein